MLINGESGHLYNGTTDMPHWPDGCCCH